MKYYKAKEFIKNAAKNEDSSYEISKHVMYTAYYALKHNIPEEELDSYIDSVIEKTHKKLYSCGCQCYLISPLGNKVRVYEGGGDYIEVAKRAFKDCVKKYYEDLYLYNSTEEEASNDGKTA
jgi:hypothetical protein